MVDKNNILEDLLMAIIPPAGVGQAKDLLMTIMPAGVASPKAHEQIDAIIGQSYESDPKILGEHATLLNYLSGAVSEEGTKNRYMHGIDEKELEKRMSEVRGYPSRVDSSGVERFTIPLMVPRSYPPQYEHESRSMQHWLEDYPLWINRSSINNP